MSKIAFHFLSYAIFISLDSLVTAYGIYGESCPNGGFENDDIMDEMVFRNHRATIDVQRGIMSFLKSSDYEAMHLHAKRLSVTHPITGESMEFIDESGFI